MLVALLFFAACIAFNRWYKATHKPQPQVAYYVPVWTWRCERCGTPLAQPFCPCDDLPDEMIPKDDFALWEESL